MNIRKSQFAIARRPTPSHDPCQDHWALVNVGTDQDPIIEVQHVRPENATPVFPNSAAAVVYVMQRACRDGCLDAREAVIEIVKSWGYKVTAKGTKVA